jgi:DNA-binding response OmpR family regulator
VLGYSDGADQYFVKPVDHEELAIALKNLARRMGAKEACWIVDVGRRKLMAPNGFQTDLSHNETMILGTLARDNAGVVKRSVLYQVTNNSDDAFGAQRLETALSRLRSKLKLAGMPDLPVKASHGAGYVFVDPVRVLGEG